MININILFFSQPNKLLAFLSRYKIFDNLCNIIKDGQNELFNDAVGALMALFTTLNITYPKPVSKVCESKNCNTNIEKHETTVTLVLDDNTLINTNKSYLSLKSPVFEAMFRDGGFKEAYESTVRLNDVSSECFNSFLLLLEKYCDCLLPSNITVLLELIMITDKYMLYDLSKKISMVMIKNSIDINNCDIIYEWLIETGHKLHFVSNVGLDVVKCLFSSNSRFPERVEAIKKITTSCYGDNFIKDLSTILKIGFTSICNDDKFTKFYLKTFDCNED